MNRNSTGRRRTLRTKTMTILRYFVLIVSPIPAPSHNANGGSWLIALGLNRLSQLQGIWKQVLDVVKHWKTSRASRMSHPCARVVTVVTGNLQGGIELSDLRWRFRSQCLSIHLEQEGRCDSSVETAGIQKVYVSYKIGVEYCTEAAYVIQLDKVVSVTLKFTTRIEKLKNSRENDQERHGEEKKSSGGSVTVARMKWKRRTDFSTR